MSEDFGYRYWASDAEREPAVEKWKQWLAARKQLLAKEKELTRQRDALNAERRELPMVAIEEDYTFEGPNGTVRLIDMLERRSVISGYEGSKPRQVLVGAGDVERVIANLRERDGGPAQAAPGDGVVEAAEPAPVHE